MKALLRIVIDLARASLSIFEVIQHKFVTPNLALG